MMNTITEEDAARALLMLDRIGNPPQRDDIPAANPLSSDEEDEEDDHPVISALVSSGGSSIFVSNTNFTEKEFFELYEVIRSELETRLASGRGCKHNTKPTDLFFMTLTCLKRGGTWDDLAFAFRCKTTTFENNTNLMFELISQSLYDKFVRQIREDWTMKEMHDENVVFRNFSSAFYATDVRFQQSLRPTGTHAESKPYFSGKHKLYGVKTEASVLPNGICVMRSRYYRGGKADISIFREYRTWHTGMTKKKEDEVNMEDDGPLVDKYPESWAILMDKGYEGSQNFIRSIHPKKKPRLGRLSVQECSDNSKIAQDRIIVERYFGRETALWAVMERQFKWSLEKYNNIMSLCTALTNFHIVHNPLNVGDELSHQRYRDRLYQKGVLVAAKRKKSQQDYRNRRRRRLNSEWDNIVERRNSQPDSHHSEPDSQSA